MMLTVDPSLPRPPYEQIREQVSAQVKGGALTPGTKLPTVRRLATDLGLAPNTVARAYRELEALGIIETRGRAGSFVSGDEAAKAAGEAVRDFVVRARGLGLGQDETLAMVRRAWS